MRKLGWLMMAVALAGCQQGGAPSPVAATSTAQEEEVVAGPGPLQPSELRMIRNDKQLALGDTWSEAINVFETPRNAFEFSQLPPRFAAPYRARGWENSRESFGVISYDDAIVTALYQRDRATIEQVDAVFALYDQAYANLKPMRIDGKSVRTMFWEQNGQRIMVQAAQTPKSGLHLTVALGQIAVMDELGASPIRAREDIAALDGSNFPEDSGAAAGAPEPPK